MGRHVSDTLQVLDNGTVIVPAVGSNGGSGGMYRKNADCEELGGHMLEITPTFEGEVWAEYWLKKAIFNAAKKYEITVRVKTDQDYGDEVQLLLRLNAKEPHYETTISVPNTNEEWETLGPFLLDVDIGGFKDTLLKVVVPQVKGQIFHIKDITFAPPGSDDTGVYSGPWWTEWLDDLNKKVVVDGGMLPTLDDDGKDVLVRTASDLRAAMKVLREEPDKEAKGALKETRNQVMQDCVTAATPILEAMDGTLSQSLLDNQEFLQWLVLVRATPTKLGAYCHQASDEQVQQLVYLLKEDTDLLKEMIVSGGAKGGFYGMACAIYYEIAESMQEGKSLLPKLQLAVALELAKALPIFDTVTPVDAVQRYFDYEKAYLNGELDPAMEQFSVWELRMVVDSDASNEELEWGRKMLMTMRPDIAYMGDQLWKYSSLVKTDVKYKRPDWYRQPRDMVQTLSRGGKCGPRAFFGRFINKAFGNPTWGVVQPSHAALAKWTPTGWFCCLGGDLGTCLGRDFEDFKYEVYMRKKFGDEHYFCKVDLLEWISVAVEEKHKSTDSFPMEDCPWHSLSLLQRKRLGDTDKPFPEAEIGQCEVLTKIEELQQREEPEKEEITVDGNGTITIPSSACHADKHPIFAKSLEGGKQFTAEENWWAEYKIPAEMVPDRKKYKLTMRIASVHDNDLSSFQWIVTSDAAHHTDKPVKEYSVQHPYTRGMWSETDPVEVELGGGDEILRLCRQKPCLPITVKDYKLTPV